MRLPELYWSRAKELQGLGRGDEAVREMLLVMRKYPAHPSFSQWLNEVESALGKMEEAQAAMSRGTTPAAQPASSEVQP